MSNVGDTRQIRLGNMGPEVVPNTATESQAVRILQGVPPEAIADAYESTFDSPEVLEELVSEARQKSRIVAPMPQGGGYMVEAEPWQACDYYPPDVAELYHVLKLLDGIELTIRMPKPFAELMGVASNAEWLIEHQVAAQVGELTQQPLLIAMQAAFIPKELREQDMPPVQAWRGPMRGSDYDHIVNSMPDLSDLSTPAERLRAVIDMLVPPTTDQARTRHAAALQQLCAAEGIASPDDIKDRDPDRYKRLHQRAGVAVLAGNLFATLLNTHHQGLLQRSVFDADSDEGSQPRTERGKCPAIPLVASYLHGVGLLLERHFDDILALMEKAAATRGDEGAIY